LILPHPRAAVRKFVMGPLAEIAPGWVHPDGETAEALAGSASVGKDAAPLR
jgi:2-amino-4-hydroxy-6-hydroxymethyldihydropteridine diphosphokinase